MNLIGMLPETIAYSASLFSVFHEYFSPVEIYSKISPSSMMKADNGTIVPPSIPTVMNEAYDNYLSRWSVISEGAIAVWLRTFKLLSSALKVDFVTNISWEHFDFLLKNHLAFIEFSDLSITYAVESGNTTVFRQLTYKELRGYKPEMTTLDFVNYITQIALFGFIVTRDQIDALRLSDAELKLYIYDRIAGGEFERELTS